jgi:hypothetical protein
MGFVEVKQHHNNRFLRLEFIVQLLLSGMNRIVRRKLSEVSAIFTQQDFWLGARSTLPPSAP